MLKKFDNKWIAESWDELGIDVPVNKLHSHRDLKLKGCPSCHEQGKKDGLDLSIRPADGYGKCHKCGVSFTVKEKSERVEYTPPTKKNMTVLSTDGLQYFTNRKITQDTVKRYKIAQEGSWAVFPIMHKGNLVSAKYRGIYDKAYKMSPNGMHCVFGYDQAIEYMEASGDFRVLITEGFEDAMSYDSQGIHFAVSVDSGAPNAKDVNVSGKLECIDNCMDLFDMADTIYIGVDNDDNGRRLQDELIRRFDVDKVRIIDYGEHKDANEAHKWGVVLSTLLDNAREIKMEGVFYAEDVFDKLDDIYNNGLPKGSTTHLHELDRIWTWRPSEVTGLTGYMNEGKTSWFHWLCILKASIDGWPVGLYSPENWPPEELYEDLIHMYVGKTMDKDYADRMTYTQLKEAKEFVNKYFYMIYPEQSASLENIFDRGQYLVKKKGIKILGIDPYNGVEHNQGSMREDLYISDFLRKLKRFTAEHSLATTLIAHQRTPEREKDKGETVYDYPKPDIYRVRGGGIFGDKLDNVLSYWRPYRRTDPSDPTVIIESHKIKNKKLTGAIGDAKFYYDWRFNRYYQDPKVRISPLDAKLAYGERR